MKDNHIDAYLGPGEENYAPIVQLATHAPIRILSFAKEDVAKMKAANPGVVPFTLDKKNYKQKNDVNTVQTFLLIITNEDVPAERVYKLTKTIYDNLGRIRRSRESLRAGQGGQRHRRHGRTAARRHGPIPEGEGTPQVEGHYAKRAGPGTPALFFRFDIFNQPDVSERPGVRAASDTWQRAVLCSVT